MAEGNSKAPDEPPDESQSDSQPQRPKRYQILVEPKLARQMGMVAAALEMSVPAYLASRMGPIVARELDEILKEIRPGKQEG